MMSSNHKNEPRVFNSIIVNNYLKLFRSKHPNIDIDDLLSYSGIERYEAEDPLQWFTQTQLSRFFKRVSEGGLLTLPVSIVYK